MKKYSFCGSVATLGFLATTVAGGATEIDLSSLTTADLNTYTNGSYYPLGGTQITVGGVGFETSTYAGGPDSGVIQLNGDPADWPPAFPASVSVPVNQAGVKTVYTLINSSFGLEGTDVGSVELVGSSGTYTYTLTEGVNVRDHYNGTFVNTATDLAGSIYFGDGSVRLDMQAFAVPSGIGTLQSVTFAAGTNYYGYGEPFLAGLTTSFSAAVPEPSTWALMLMGFAGLGYAGYRRREKSLSPVAAG